MKRIFKNPHFQRGVTGVQLAIFGAVTTLIVIGGVGMTKYIEKQKVSNEQSELNDLKTQSINFAAKHGGSYAGLTLAIACDQGFFPKQRCTGTGASTTVTNLWGGSVTLAIVNVNGTNDGVKWSYPGLSTQACVDEVTTMWDYTAKIDVDTTVVKDAVNKAIDDTATNTACKAAADNATVKWTFANI
jgi:hypothetical protein